jgi:hypothetical protein
MVVKLKIVIAQPPFTRGLDSVAESRVCENALLDLTLACGGKLLTGKIGYVLEHKEKKNYLGLLR